MVNKHKQKVCDLTSIIVDDGVTIIPGYIEVLGGEVFLHESIDPNNHKLGVGVIRFRCKDEVGKSLVEKVRVNFKGKLPKKTCILFLMQNF